MNHLNIRHFLWGFAVILLAGALSTAVWTGLIMWSRQGGWDERSLEGLGSFGTLPDFSLIERSGKRLTLSDLRGKIWVADLIYTTCKDTCPLQSAEMARLQADLADRADLKLVSISIDPERDTPEVLSRYAERYHANPERWLFLTGKKQAIYNLAQEGFRLSAVPVSDDTEKNNHVILHSSRFVLVDGQKQIRGYYDSNDAEALRRLRRDVKTLLRKHRT